MFDQSISAIGPGYLGSEEVVDRLVRGFIGRVLELRSKDDLRAACYDMASIFAGHNKDYTVNEAWTGMGGLLQCLSDRLGVDLNQYGFHVLEQSFAHFDALIRYMTAVLIGAANALYPAGRTWESNFEPE